VVKGGSGGRLATHPFMVGTDLVVTGNVDPVYAPGDKAQSVRDRPSRAVRQVGAE
jgi:hypothetical protein